MNAAPVRLLIVEDEPLAARMLTVLARGLGYEPVGPAASADAALDLVRATELPIDVALLDINIDGNRDGIALAHELRAMQALPIIFLTSLDDEETFGRAKLVRPAAYLLKPYNAPTLQHALELALLNFANDRAALPPGPAVAGKVIDFNGLDGVSADESELAYFNSGTAALLVPDALFIKEEGLLVKVRLAEIQAVEAADKQCHLTLPGRIVTVRQPLRELAQRLPGTDFVQIHRSYIINFNHIERIDTVRNLVQVGQQVLPLSLTHREELLRRLTQV